MKKYILIFFVLSCIFLLFTISHVRASTLYYNNATFDNDWNTLANWWTDAEFTTPAGSLPASGDNVMIWGVVGTNSGPAVSVNSMTVYDSNYLSIPVSVSNVATFNDFSQNLDVVTGDVVFNDNSLNTNNYVTYNIIGNATFNDSSLSYGSISGDATFNNNSFNQGNIYGISIFNNLSFNQGEAHSDAEFNDSSRNSSGATVDGSATFNDFSYNESTISGDAFFNNFSHNDLEVSSHATFYDFSYNNGTIDIDAIFYDSTLNGAGGVVTRDACFATTATNNGGVGGTTSVCGGIASPTVTTGSSDLTISFTASILGGEITDTGGESAGTVGIEYGESTSYGSSASRTGAFVRGPFGVVIPTLSCATTYHYRAFATNSEGTNYGSDANFTTGSCSLPDRTLYAIDGTGTNPSAPNLYTLNPETGAIVTTIGPVGYYITGLAFDPTTNILYGSSGSVGDNPRSLFTIDTETGAGTYLGTIKTGKTQRIMPDIAFRSDGRLYGLSNDGNLYTIDISSCNGATCPATRVATSGFSAYGDGLAFDSSDNLYLFGNGDISYRQIDPDTGALISENIFSNPSLLVDNTLAGVSLGAAKFNRYDTLFAARTFGTTDYVTDLIAVDFSTNTIISTGENNADMVNMSAIAFSSVDPSAGSLSVNIVDGDGVPVTTPALAMESTAFSFTSQVAGGTFGISNQKIRVDNPTTDPAWALSLAATDGGTAFWNGTMADYDFNDETASGGDGADADSLGGQMTVNASVATITPQSGCTNTGLSLGSSSSYAEGTIDDITILSADSSADTSCYWEITGIDISQTIPKEQPVDSYAVNMSLTMVAI